MRIVVADSFWTGMSRVSDFLSTAEMQRKYEELLEDFDKTIIPNLEAFPMLGKLYISEKQHSTEALMAVAKLPRDASKTLRQYIHDDYIILYVLLPEMIHIVSIRHHNEAGFNP